MELSRQHFDSVGTLDAMDEIAMLVFVSQELRKMAKSFANSPEIDKRHAKKPATVVLEICEEVAESLMAPLFGKNAKRTIALNIARKRGAEKLDSAITEALVLADMEHVAFAGNGVRGNTIQVQVVANLNKLVATWRNLPM